MDIIGIDRHLPPAFEAKYLANEHCTIRPELLQCSQSDISSEIEAEENLGDPSRLASGSVRDKGGEKVVMGNEECAHTACEVQPCGGFGCKTRGRIPQGRDPGGSLPAETRVCSISNGTTSPYCHEGMSDKNFRVEHAFADTRWRDDKVTGSHARDVEARSRITGSSRHDASPDDMNGGHLHGEESSPSPCCAGEAWAHSESVDEEEIVVEAIKRFRSFSTVPQTFPSNGISCGATCARTPRFHCSPNGVTQSESRIAKATTESRVSHSTGGVLQSSGRFELGTEDTDHGRSWEAWENKDLVLEVNDSFRAITTGLHVSPDTRASRRYRITPTAFATLLKCA